MGEAACDVLEVELALDLLEAKLAIELPQHMRAFAKAHAAGRPPPNAPLILGLASTLETARNACMHDLLVERGLAMLRLVAPLAIEDDPRVSALHAGSPSWSGLTALAAVRDATAHQRFGRRASTLVHELHGAIDRPSHGEVDTSALPGWKTTDRELDGAAIAEVWQLIATRFGVRGNVQLERTAGPPRTFVIVPGSEVIVVVPAVVASPAARFAVLHELGHAVAALALPAGIPRALDEAAAAYVARLAEPPSWLPAPWHSELAASACRRRTAIAQLLAHLELALPELPSVPPSATPPQALWDDPGAQACYVEAEVIADRWHREIGDDSAGFVRALGAERERIDRSVPRV